MRNRFELLIRAVLYPHFVVRFFARRAKKRTTDETRSTLLPQADAFFAALIPIRVPAYNFAGRRGPSPRQTSIMPSLPIRRLIARHGPGASVRVINMPCTPLRYWK